LKDHALPNGGGEVDIKGALTVSRVEQEGEGAPSAHAEEVTA